MSKRRRFWVTRDDCGSFYELWTIRPKHRGVVWFGPQITLVGKFCPTVWERTTGVKMPGGKDSIKKIYITFEVKPCREE